MKLRVRNNSIRFRLSQSEIDQFKKSGYIEEAIEFGGNSRLIYALAAAETDVVNARFENDKITVFVPQTEADNWTEAERIGIETKQSVNDGKLLRILIEKDLASDN